MSPSAESLQPQARRSLAWMALLAALGVAMLVTGVELRQGSWHGVATVLLDAFKNPPPIDVIPLVGVVVLCALAFVSRFSNRWMLWTCGVTTVAYALVASDGLDPIVVIFNLLFGFICAGIPVLIAALVGRLVPHVAKLPRAGLMFLSGVVMIPVAFAAYMSVFGI